jgi:hypothetical protein
MTRLLSLLTLCLLLFTTSCKKDDIGPSLEGRWNFRLTVLHVYLNGGVLLDKFPGGKANSYYMLLTSTTQELIDLPTNSSRGLLSFTRQGNVLTFQDGRQLVITELTAKTLTLRDKNPGPPLLSPADYQEVDYHYVR